MPNAPVNVALITGASEGIGRALAHQLAAQGDYDTLVLTARSQERLASLAAELEEHDVVTVCLPADLTEPSQCTALIEKTLEQCGRLDTLFNNAGATMWAPFSETTDLDVFKHVMDVNYFGALYCTHAALPALTRSRGRIVVVASLAGITGVPCRTGYCASKHAVIGFFESLRIELQGSGVSVTIVAPDFVVSSIHKRALTGDGTPLGDSPMQEGKIMSAERCAALIAKAAQRRERLRITSLRGKLGRYVRLLFPGFIDRIATRAIDKGR
jgi:short-subunit dehydrogenase